MATNLNIQAEVIDIRNDTPQTNEIFIVDTNVWVYMAYSKAALSGAQPYQVKNYPRYLRKALSNGATLKYSGITLAELAHSIEVSERNIYADTHGKISAKKFRHNCPNERKTVVSEIQEAWDTVEEVADFIDLTIDKKITDSIRTRLKTQEADSYDLLNLEAIRKARKGKIKIITDDGDYATVPDIQVFTSNLNIINPATAQNKLLVR